MSASPFLSIATRVVPSGTLFITSRLTYGARLQLLGARAPVALEAELDVLRGHGVTVVELEAAAELELVREPIRTFRPRLRQARAHFLTGQRPHERVVERVQHAERRDLGGRRRRIEPRRRDGDVPDHDGLASGSLRGCQGDHRQEEGDRGEQAGETMRSDSPEHVVIAEAEHPAPPIRERGLPPRRDSGPRRRDPGRRSRALRPTRGESRATRRWSVSDINAHYSAVAAPPMCHRAPLPPRYSGRWNGESAHGRQSASPNPK